MLALPRQYPSQRPFAPCRHALRTDGGQRAAVEPVLVSRRPLAVRRAVSTGGPALASSNPTGRFWWINNCTWPAVDGWGNWRSSTR